MRSARPSVAQGLPGCDVAGAEGPGSHPLRPKFFSRAMRLIQLHWKPTQFLLVTLLSGEHGAKNRISRCTLSGNRHCAGSFVEPAPPVSPRASVALRGCEEMWPG